MRSTILSSVARVTAVHTLGRLPASRGPGYTTSTRPTQRTGREPGSSVLGIAGVGTFLVGATIAFLPSLIGILLGLLVFLLLVKHYFKTGWLGALGVGIMAIVVGVVIFFLLGALAFTALFGFPSIPGL